MPTRSEVAGPDWHRRVVDRSLRAATKRSIDRGAVLIATAAALLERNGGDGFTVQDVADEAGQSLRTLYQYFESKDDLLLAVFEEAMGIFATMLEAAIADLHDPTERVAGVVLAAMRLPERSPSSAKGGLARLRLKLTEVEPELIGRSQAPVAALLRGLVEAAIADGSIAAIDAEAATYLLMALTTAATTSHTLGNELGVHPPGVLDLATFCLQGLGAALPASRLVDVEARLRLPKGKLSMLDVTPRTVPGPEPVSPRSRAR